ncbi:MAG: hypothetical protein WCP14_03425 [bacterium]
MEVLYFFPYSFFWWYSKAPSDLLYFLKALFSNLNNNFSIIVIIKTLFSPWKRMAMSRGKGIYAFRDWFFDNLISRGVGFVVRTLLILAYILSLISYIIFSIFLIIAWAFLPALVVLAFINIFWEIV